MSEQRSHELDQVRQILFPNLSEEDGWARIDAAFAGASNAERIDAIERLAGGDLGLTLFAELRRQRDE